MGSGGTVAKLEFVGLQLRGIVQHQRQAETFGQLLQAEVPRWAKIVKDSGASLN